MATKGLVGGTNTTTTTVTASGNTTSAVTTEVNNNSGIQARIGATQTMSASAVSTTPVPVEYTGAESDSMYVTVDNKNRTISGEVKWHSMIAATEAQEDSNHAYPANKARINFNDIQDKLNTVNNRITVLTESCTNANQNVSGYVDQLQKVQEDLAQVIKDCSALGLSLTREQLARENTDITLASDVASAKQQLEDGFDELQRTILDTLNTQDNRISKTQKDLETENERAVQREGELSRTIQNTSVSLVNTQNDLTNLSLQTESLRSELQALQTSGVTETVVDHTQRISELQQQVTNVNMKFTSQLNNVSSTVSQMGDIVYKNNSVLSSVDSKVKEAKSDVNSLRNQLTKQERDVDKLETVIEAEIEKRDTEFISLSAQIQGEAEVRRTTDTHHNEELKRLEVRISNLQTRLFEIIENLGNELRARDDNLAVNIQNVTFTFVDAGTAPI